MFTGDQLDWFYGVSWWRNWVYFLNARFSNYKDACHNILTHLFKLSVLAFYAIIAFLVLVDILPLIILWINSASLLETCWYMQIILRFELNVA